MAILSMRLFERSRSTFIDRDGRQILNYYFSLCIFAAAMLLLILFVLGYFALLLADAILVFGIASGTRGAVVATRGQSERPVLRQTCDVQPAKQARRRSFTGPPPELKRPQKPERGTCL
ncbi:MAG: DUF4870 domain-containing protein [Acidimicrobiales bacterium]